MVKIAEELEKCKNGEISSEDLYDKLRWSTTEIKEELAEQGRWMTLYSWVVKDEEDRYWSFCREMGSTECQDCEDFDPYTIREVEPYERIIVDYRPIKKEIGVKNG